MSITKDQILEQLKSFRPDEQEEIAEAIWLMAHDETREEIDKAWAAELQSRVDEADRGEGSWVSVEEALRQLESKGRK